jgi:hypothetical protein
MSKLDKDQVLSEFTEAYKKAHGKEPQIEVKSGWYSIDGGKNIRLAGIADMTSELSGGATAAPAKEEKVEAKPAKATKKAAAPVSVAKAASFTVVKKGDGLNPANFWLEYLAGLNSDSRAPHGFY